MTASLTRAIKRKLEGAHTRRRALNLQQDRCGAEETERAAMGMANRVQRCRRYAAELRYAGGGFGNKAGQPGAASKPHASNGEWPVGKRRVDPKPRRTGKGAPHARRRSTRLPGLYPVTRW